MVIFAHSYYFTNERGDPLYILSKHTIDLSYLGLAIFFFLSGLLVTQSLYNSSSWKNFLWKRFLRLYPAAWLVILVSMFILGPLLTTFPVKAYFTSQLFFAYAKGLSLIQINYFLPGVFTKSVLNPSVNASLWSISLELKLYIGLLIFYLFKIPHKKIILILIIILIFITEHFFYNQVENFIRNFNEGFILYSYVVYAPYFLIGVLCFLFKDKLFINFFIAFIAITIACLCVQLNCFSGVRSLIIPILVLYVASLQFPLIKKITPAPDISYGLYVFAFPVQQIISQFLGKSGFHAWQMFLLCIISTLPFALFSWYKVEQNSLSFKNKVK